MDTSSENMVLEKRDLDYILSAYLRSYLFYNKNTPPKEIHVPMIPAVRNFRDKAGSMIPVKFEEFKGESVHPQEILETPEEEEIKEEQSAIIRPKRTSGDREPTKTVSPSSKDAPKSDKKV